MFDHSMIDHADFLKQQAAALRALAQRAPKIAEDLRRLADDLEAKAAELDQIDEAGRGA